MSKTELMRTMSDIYREQPGNYFLIGDGAAGKSTQLEIIRRELLGKKVRFSKPGNHPTANKKSSHEKSLLESPEKTIVPVYVRLIELNAVLSSVVDDNWLLTLVQGYFRTYSLNGIKELLQKMTDEGYQILFLLDGENELIVDPQDKEIYPALRNGIHMLMQEYHAQFIISLRAIQNKLPLVFGLDISKELFSSFTVCRLDELSEKQVKSYLGGLYEKRNKSILTNPMLCLMYKAVKEENPLFSFEEKNELVDEFFKLQCGNKKDETRYEDTTYQKREQVYEEIIPFIAYQMESLYLEGSDLDGKHVSIEKMLRSYLRKKAKSNDSKRTNKTCGKAATKWNKQLQQVLLEEKHVDEKAVFSHQIYMEYFASKGFMQADAKGKICFMEELTKKLWYDKETDKTDLERRTQYLGLAESLAYEMRNLTFSREIFEGISRIRSLDILQSFYQEFAGVYDDLHNLRTADYAFLSYFLLKELEQEQGKVELKESYKTMVKINFLFFCLLKDPQKTYSADGRTYTLKMLQAELEAYVNSHEPGEKEIKLYGKIYNNFGAFFYALKEYEKAYEGHLEALEFRKENGALLLNSYRSLMSDVYHLCKKKNAKHSIVEAYEYYLKGREAFALSEKQRKEEKKEKKEEYKPGKFPVDFAERALGVVLQVMEDDAENLSRAVTQIDDKKRRRSGKTCHEKCHNKTHGDNRNLPDEALELAEYVLKEATNSERKDENNLRNLREKISWMLTNQTLRKKMGKERTARMEKIGREIETYI